MNVNTSQWYEIHLRLHRQRDADAIRHIKRQVKQEHGNPNAALRAILRKAAHEDKTGEKILWTGERK